MSYEIERVYTRDEFFTAENMRSRVNAEGLCGTPFTHVLSGKKFTISTS
jgi:hypothetical protein